MNPEAKSNRPMVLKYRRQLQSLLELTESGKLVWVKYTDGERTLDGELTFMCQQPEVTLIVSTDLECEDVSLDFVPLFEDDTLDLCFDPYDDDVCISSMQELAQVVQDKYKQLVDIDPSDDASVHLDSIIQRLGGAA